MVAVVVGVVVVVVEVADGVVVVATDDDVVVAVVDVAAAAAAGGARSVRMVVHLQRSRSEHLGAAAMFAAAAALAETSSRQCAVRASTDGECVAKTSASGCVS